jgi:hypothetical protein
VALRYQKALVRKVLDETLDFDNVIYSLGNECPSPAAWNEFWAAFIRSHAADKSARRVFVTNMWRHDLPIFDVFDIQDAQHPYRVRRVNAEGMWNAYRAVDTRQREQDRIKPVWTMQPLWDAVVEGQGYAFGRPGDEYVVYLPDGGSISLAVPAEPDLYEFYWYDPDRGGAHPPGTVSISTARNSVLTLTAPSKQDWVLHAGRHKLRPPAADRLLP